MVVVTSGAFALVFKQDYTVSFIVSLCPVVLFIIICFTCKSDTQLKVAELLTVGYTLLMVAMFVAMVIQVNNNLRLPTSWIIITFFVIPLVTAIFHPQEFNCIYYFPIYWLTLPSMSLLLTIYTVFNLDNVSWGTRYTHYNLIMTAS